MAKKTVNQEMKIKTRKISDLIRAEYNPRELTKEQQNQLTDSLKRFGLVDPIIVNTHKDRKNILVGGHQRMKVWESMGNETIPTVEVNLNLEKEKELNVRLNKNTGQFDMELIQEHFETDDLIEWGFDAEELEFFEPEVLEAEEDDFSVPDEIKTDIVLGDLIEIGKHRLLCGDSTCSDTVAKLMNGEKADLLLTDPPYGIDYGNQLIKGEKFKEKTNKHGWRNFGNPKWDESKPQSGVLQYLCQITTNQIIWGGNYFTEDLAPTMGWLIWDKGQRGFSLADGEMAWTSFNNALRIKEYARAKANREDKKHPTQKPIEIMDLCFKYADRHSKNDISIVFDAYLGSGSTMVAAHQLKRKCYGMELDPKYCQVIVDRMMKLDESLTVKINGKPYKK